MYIAHCVLLFILHQIRDASVKGPEHPRSTNELLASLAAAEQLAEEVMMDRHQASVHFPQTKKYEEELGS